MLVILKRRMRRLFAPVDGTIGSGFLSGLQPE